MSISKQLDAAIAALDSGRPSVEVKGHLVAIREQIEAYEETAQQQAGSIAQLNEAHAKEVARLNKLITERDELLAAFKANANLHARRGPRSLPG